MSKRGVTFTKPDEPSFLRKIKEQVGYKEGPSINTKREALDIVTEEDLEDTADEQPTIVVLQPGDITAEEAAEFKEQQKRESEEAPADLSATIVFKAPSKKSKNQDTNLSKRVSGAPDLEKKPKKQKTKALLSFDEEENDD